MRKKAFLLNPSEYFVFALAENLGKTVQELLTGRPGEFSNAEFVGWAAYYKVKQSKQKQAEKKAARSRRRGGRRR